MLIFFEKQHPLEGSDRSLNAYATKKFLTALSADGKDIAVSSDYRNVRKSLPLHQSPVKRRLVFLNREVAF